MQIVAKMTRDYIPKAIMYNIVQNVSFVLIDIFYFFFFFFFFFIFKVQKFVSKELLAHLYALPDPVKSFKQLNIIDNELISFRNLYYKNLKKNDNVEKQKLPNLKLLKMFA